MWRTQRCCVPGVLCCVVLCRRYLQELAEREVVRAAASGNMWYCASHPEHVRPMLQVCVGFVWGLEAVLLMGGVLPLCVWGGLYCLSMRVALCLLALSYGCVSVRSHTLTRVYVFAQSAGRVPSAAAGSVRRVHKCA
jgi:hypothetical protein